MDGVCSEVCREITQVIERERGRGEVLTSRSDDALDRLETAQRQSHASILHAYTTLYQAFGELMDLKEVTKAVPKEKTEEHVATERRLTDVVRELKDEAETIARTNRRLRETRVPGTTAAACGSMAETVVAPMMEVEG